MSVIGIPGGAMSEELDDEQRVIVELLTSAYWMEIETVMNYLAAANSHPGSAALAVRTALRESAEQEVVHARALGRRIQQLHGVVPGIGAVAGDQAHSQPFEHQTDLAGTIEAVVAAETSAIRDYMRIMRATKRVDPETNDLVLEILRDEQRRLRRFESCLADDYAQAA